MRVKYEKKKRSKSEAIKRQERSEKEGSGGIISSGKGKGGKEEGTGRYMKVEYT